jgi:hypothetical protein
VLREALEEVEAGGGRYHLKEGKQGVTGRKSLRVGQAPAWADIGASFAREKWKLAVQIGIYIFPYFFLELVSPKTGAGNIYFWSFIFCFGLSFTCTLKLRFDTNVSINIQN